MCIAFQTNATKYLQLNNSSMHLTLHRRNRKACYCYDETMMHSHYEHAEVNRQNIKLYLPTKTKELIKQTSALHDLTENADAMINKLVSQEQNWITKSLIKLIN